nr:hypothetical protein [Aquitalea magnusonii]
MQALSREALLRKIEVDIGALLPDLNGLQPSAAQLIVEKRATFASTVGLTDHTAVAGYNRFFWRETGCARTTPPRWKVRCKAV